VASGWRFFLGQPDCPDGLSRSGRGRLVTEVEGKNSAVWEAAGPRGTGFLVNIKKKTHIHTILKNIKKQILKKDNEVLKM